MMKVSRHQPLRNTNQNTNKIKYRLVKKYDFLKLANIYCSLYTNSSLNENWNQKSALNLLKHFYILNPDIFVVAEIDSEPIGAIMSLVKPWYDGNRLIETEIFVDSTHQQNGIGSQLFLEHFRLAIQKYNAKTIEAYTYKEANGYPLNWYMKQGYDINHNLFVINGEISKVYKYLKTH